ncbi:hypothetical protein QBC47DRAFT_311673, partial [Echria macrotheca]
SKLKGCEEDLKDIAFNLQWQQYNFLTWAETSGLLEAYAHHKQTGGDDKSMSADTIALLAPELRRGPALALVLGTVQEMQQRLEDAKPLLGRYFEKPAAVPTSGRLAMVERISRTLSKVKPTDRSESLIKQDSHLEIRKRDRLRLVAGDKEKLTSLVTILDKRNSSLRNSLMAAQLENINKKLDVMVVAWPSFAQYLASLPTDQSIPSSAATPGIGCGQRQKTLGFLVSERLTEAPEESLQSDSLPPASSISSRNKAARPSLTSPLASQSVIRSKHDIDFPPRDTSSPDQLPLYREFASIKSRPVMVEWRYYSTKTDLFTLNFIDTRVNMLALQLRHLSALDGAGTLPCYGYFHDKAQHRHGIVYNFPADRAEARPITLRQRLESDHGHKKRVQRDLADRFALARTLILTVYQLLHVRWLHKGLCGDNILLFENAGNDDLNSIQAPFVCGFVFSRRDAAVEMSEKLATVHKEKGEDVHDRLYWHPERFAIAEAAEESEQSGLRTKSYKREFDLYSLGILLLEVGLWSPVERIYANSRNKDVREFVDVVKKSFIPELRGRMGKTYAEVVRACIEGKFGDHIVGEGQSIDEDQETALFLESFKEAVVDPMDYPLGKEYGWERLLVNRSSLLVLIHRTFGPKFPSDISCAQP